MASKHKILLKAVVPFGIIFVLIAIFTAAFYLASFIKLNDMVKVATVNNIENSKVSEKETRFTLEHLMALKVTDNEIGENDFIEYNAKKKITALSWGFIEYTIEIDARKIDWDTWEEKETYSGTRIVAFRFDTKELKWQVESVKTQ